MNKLEFDQNDITKKTERLSLKSKCVGIYGLKNKITNKWYVGQSWDVERRFLTYKSLNCIGQTKIYNSIKKYGFCNFDVVLLEACDRNQDILNQRESYWIEFYNSIENGYNLRDGGSKGKYSNESKNKMRLLKIGKPRNQETCGKIHQSHKLKYKNDLDYRASVLNRIPHLTKYRTELSRSINPSWGIRLMGKKFRVIFKENGTKIYKCGFSSIEEATVFRDDQLKLILSKIKTN
jgi:group I intron endonuclease